MATRSPRSTTRRIRRSDHGSDFFKNDSPVRLTRALHHPLANYKARYGQSGWRRIGTPGEDDFGSEPIRSRTTYAVVELSGRCVAKVKLLEYEFPTAQATELFDVMDAHDRAHSELIATILSAWPDFGFSIAEAGSVLVIDRIWVEPSHSTPAVWVPIAADLASRREGELVLVIAKAYPLEYEAQVDQRDVKSQLERRQRAMIRYYSRHGFSLLPGRSGKNGWMWRAPPRARIDIDPPVFRPKASFVSQHP